MGSHPIGSPCLCPEHGRRGQVKGVDVGVEASVVEEKNYSDSVDTRAIFFAIYHLSGRVIERLRAMPDEDTEETAALRVTYLTLSALLKLLAPHVGHANPLDPPETLPN